MCRIVHIRMFPGFPLPPLNQRHHRVRGTPVAMVGSLLPLLLPMASPRALVVRFIPMTTLGDFLNKVARKALATGPLVV